MHHWTSSLQPSAVRRAAWRGRSQRQSVQTLRLIVCCFTRKIVGCLKQVEICSLKIYSSIIRIIELSLKRGCPLQLALTTQYSADPRSISLLGHFSGPQRHAGRGAGLGRSCRADVEQVTRRPRRGARPGGGHRPG